MKLDPTPELLDLIIRQDKLRMCELQERFYRHPEVALWAFHRWERSSREFKLTYPALTPRQPFPSNLYTSLEGRKALVDKNLPLSYGGWAETEKYPVTILIPLCYNTELVGLLQGFTSVDVDSARKIVRSVSPRTRLLAQSWHMIGLLEEKERIACTDSLTGLFNSKFLLHFLKAELARCARYKKSVAVLFLDIDFFKRVNDVYGHLVGSAVLSEMGKLIRSSVRDADTVARYGGDEYVVVLTEIGREDGVRIAERLRKTVEAHRFGERQGLLIELTISAGVAAFPEHGRTAAELVHRSDAAMYDAKRDNRNCVKVAT